MKNKYDVVIIGAGASGLMCASRLSLQKKVIVLEKMSTVGKKLRICGKGRCNVTNNSDVENIIKNIRANAKFMYSAIYNFTPYNVMEYFESRGVPLKTERGNRVFPVSDKSIDIVNALVEDIEKNGGKISLNTCVKNILLDDNKKILGVKLLDGNSIYADNVVVCTGGLSYKATGSTGDGYIFAKNTGHRLISNVGALVPLCINDKDCTNMQGLSLKNVTLTLKNKNTNKTLYKEQGELLFTHFGISGPLALRASFFIDYNNIKNHIIIIDLKPALSEKVLDDRILRDFNENINKNFMNSLDALLPKKMIPTIIKKTGILKTKKVNEITKIERNVLLQQIKNLTFNIDSVKDINYAIVTRGGVSTKDINPSTMESKIVEKLYFAGEVIDVDAYTGGFNLQMAFSSGVLAADNILEV